MTATNGEWFAIKLSLTYPPRTQDHFCCNTMTIRLRLPSHVKGRCVNLSTPQYPPPKQRFNTIKLCNGLVLLIKNTVTFSLLTCPISLISDKVKFSYLLLGEVRLRKICIKLIYLRLCVPCLRRLRL